MRQESKDQPIQNTCLFCLFSPLTRYLPNNAYYFYYFYLFKDFKKHSPMQFYYNFYIDINDYDIDSKITTLME